MSSKTALSPTLQTSAAFQHELVQMQKQLAETKLENRMLRRQLHQATALLDIAVSKLGSMGVALETPIDIHALRAEAEKQMAMEPSQPNIDAGGGDAKDNQQLSSQNTKKFQLCQHLKEHTKAVLCGAFAKSKGDEACIATGGLDCRIVLQECFTGKKLWEARAHDEGVSDLAWTRNYSLISGSYDGTVRVWNPMAGGDFSSESTTAALHEYRTDGAVLSVAPCGDSVYAWSDVRGRTGIVDWRMHGKGLLQDHEYRVNSLSFDEAERRLLMGHTNGVVSVWDLRKLDAPLPTDDRQGPVGGGAPSDEQRDARGAATAAGHLRGRPDSVPLEEGGGPRPSPTPSKGTASADGVELDTHKAYQMKRLYTFENDHCRSSISYLSHFISDDDLRRLAVVSGDNMVRLYRGNISAFATGLSAAASYALYNVVPNIPTVANTMRCGFWKGIPRKAGVNVHLLDEGDRENEVAPVRGLLESDLLVTGGPDNTAQVFDVTDEKGAIFVERLEGHRDRVTGAAVCRSRKPIIATMSSDATVCIWTTIKS